MADRIVILHEGRVVAEGTLAELARSVRDRFRPGEEINLEKIFIALLRPEPSGAGV
jgi:ABC-type multidrug transport system ATPase subunit